MCNPYTANIDTRVVLYSMPDRSDFGFDHDPDEPRCNWCAGSLDHSDGAYCPECASVLATDTMEVRGQ